MQGTIGFRVSWHSYIANKTLWTQINERNLWLKISFQFRAGAPIGSESHVSRDPREKEKGEQFPKQT